MAFALATYIQCIHIQNDNWIDAGVSSALWCAIGVAEESYTAIERCSTSGGINQPRYKDASLTADLARLRKGTVQRSPLWVVNNHTDKPRSIKFRCSNEATYAAKVLNRMVREMRTTGSLDTVQEDVSDFIRRLPIW